MVGIDKIVHFVVSMILTILFAIAVKSVNADVPGYLCGIFGGIVTMCLGVGKEIWDKFRGTGFDLMDLIADLGGCVVAVIFSIFM
jgi:VanZ family protein